MKSKIYKISIFCCVFVLFVGSFSMSVSAKNDFNEYTQLTDIADKLYSYMIGLDYPVNVANDYKDFVLSQDESNKKVLFLLPDVYTNSYPLLIYRNSDSADHDSVIFSNPSGTSLCFCFYNSVSKVESSNRFGVYIYDSINSAFDYQVYLPNYRDYSFSSIGNLLNAMHYYSSEHGYFSNVNVYRGRSTSFPSAGSVFFYPTTFPVPPLVNQAQMTMAGKTILQNLGGLAVSLVALVVGSLSLRKGWRFLKTQLLGA